MCSTEVFLSVFAVLPVIADTRLARAAVSDCESFAGALRALRSLRLPQRESLFNPDRTGGYCSTGIRNGQVVLVT